MNNNCSNGDNEKIVMDKAGGTEAGNRLSQMLSGNPQLRSILEKLSPSDARKLGTVLADPQRMKSVLDSPQAQKLIEKMNNGGKK